MYELIQAAGNSYYIDCPAKIGLVRTGEDEVCLIDSGSDKEAGRKVRQILDSHSWKLKSVFITHSNADHIGGCSYLQKQSGCRIYAPGIECCFTRHSVLEPAFLYGGFPSKDLRHKFLMAAQSEAMYLTDDVLENGMKAIPLPGHFFDMTGFRTADDVVYLADCLSSRQTLEKYAVTFIYDVESYLSTLDMVSRMEARLFVPSHADACEDISALARYNMDKVNEIAERICGFCREPKSCDEVIRCIFISYGLCMNMQQYVLVGSTVRSYLSWLKDRGVLESVPEDGMILWKTL